MSELDKIVQQVLELYKSLISEADKLEATVAGLPGRRFVLARSEDVHGNSGTGYVATGIRFINGKVAMCWNTKTSSIAIYDSIEDLESIHGHEGRTVVEWVD